MLTNSNMADALDTLCFAEAVCCVLLLCPADDPTHAAPSPALEAVLNAGVPVVVWLRKAPGDEAAMRKTLEGLCSVPDTSLELNKLPEKVRAVRRASLRDAQHAGNHLVLLYEDPGRPAPPEAPLGTPPGRGN
jgi:hypothetical protein